MNFCKAIFIIQHMIDNIGMMQITWHIELPVPLFLFWNNLRICQAQGWILGWRMCINFKYNIFSNDNIFLTVVWGIYIHFCKIHQEGCFLFSYYNVYLIICTCLNVGVTTGCNPKEFFLVDSDLNDIKSENLKNLILEQKVLNTNSK